MVIRSFAWVLGASLSMGLLGLNYAAQPERAVELVYLGSASALKGIIVAEKLGKGSQHRIVAAEGAGQDATLPGEPSRVFKWNGKGKVLLGDPTECIAKTPGDMVSRADWVSPASGAKYEVRLSESRPKSRTDEIISIGAGVLEISVNGKTVLKQAIEPEGIRPCSIEVGNFHPAKGDELAITWVSVGAGYSVGVSVYRLK